MHTFVLNLWSFSSLRPFGGGSNLVVRPPLWTSIFKVRTTLDDLLRLVKHRSQGLAEAPRRSSCGRGRGALRPARGRVKPQWGECFPCVAPGPAAHSAARSPAVFVYLRPGEQWAIPTHHGYTVTTLPHDFNVDSFTIKLTVWLQSWLCDQLTVWKAVEYPCSCSLEQPQVWPWPDGFPCYL